MMSSVYKLEVKCYQKRREDHCRSAAEQTGREDVIHWYQMTGFTLKGKCTAIYQHAATYQRAYRHTHKTKQNKDVVERYRVYNDLTILEIIFLDLSCLLLFHIFRYESFLSGQDFNKSVLAAATNYYFLLRLNCSVLLFRYL